MKMPVINVESIELDDLESALVKRILGRESRLRSQKPEIDYTIVEKPVKFGDKIHIRKYREPDYEGGCAAYLWRMVAFSISPNYQHHCMPVCAYYDLPGDTEEDRRILAKMMDELADKIVNGVKVSEWHGVRRWASVLG